ncbi:MAG TPA: ATP-binding protein [Chloroflexia bacterium]|nr:ATP-binding protein [Chloroflexia bacterium]
MPSQSQPQPAYPTNGVSYPTQNGSSNGAGSGPDNGIFAAPSGPRPEDIPGFPFPDATELAQSSPSVTTITGAMNTVVTGQQANGQTNPNIQPLQTARQTAPTPSLPGTTGPMQQRPPAGNPPRPPYAAYNNNGVDNWQNSYIDPLETLFPEPRSLAETGINQGLIADLVIKAMYFTSYMSGQDISSVLRLPYYGILDQIIMLMKKEQLCEVSGTSGLGEAGYQYVLTIKGMERAHQVLERSSYVGACPVPLGRYIETLKVLTSNKPTIFRDMVESALRGMIISEDLTNAVGAAVNAGKSLFLFGSPGNGKTLLAERIATMLGGNMAIPYSIEADGQIIQMFDLNSHRPVSHGGTGEMDSTRAELADRRWVRVHRPVVVVGGELTMSSLDLVYNENSGFYEAPFQLKANGGLFLIDDFGRQQVSPQALLNRWIVPLEKGIDYLTLKTGKKLQVPFELFLVLSTNLSPEDLIDDAFLRRIQNKLSVPDPTPQQFLDIFVGQCKTMGIPFDQGAFNYLIKKHYIEQKRPFRASQPRDLLRQLIGIARYRNVALEMTPQLLDSACATYFVNTKK